MAVGAVLMPAARTRHQWRIALAARTPSHTDPFEGLETQPEGIPPRTQSEIPSPGNSMRLRTIELSTLQSSKWSREAQTCTRGTSRRRAPPT